MSPTSMTAVALTTAVRGQDPTTARHLLSGMSPQQLRDLALHLSRFASIAALIDAAPEVEEECVSAAVALAARAFSVPVREVLSESRRRPVMEARQVACYAARLALNMPYTTIGRHVGRDHSTVMNAVSRVGESPRLRRIATEVAAQLGWDRNLSEEIA